MKAKLKSKDLVNFLYLKYLITNAIINLDKILKGMLPKPLYLANNITEYRDSISFGGAKFVCMEIHNKE